ncbi:MAG TPA: sialate O-acetylesterase [Chitinophagaceae bacterium]|nr:sialate O-acetylesterase [Chitinophagaceae bacterium]
MKWCLISVILFSTAATAQLKLAKIFTDNMVLQRNKPVKITGTAVPGKTISVSFGNETKTVVAGSDSSWMISFKKQKENLSPQTITARCGEDKLEIRNVLIGDVWLCLGQSNMQWPVEREMHAVQALATASQPLLRFYNPSYAGENIYNSPFTDSVAARLNEPDFYKGSWEQSDSHSVRTMSAVGYYFGKAILLSEKIPVGLIDLSIGGAPAETFIRRGALQNDLRFSAKVKSDWLENESLPVWIRERGRQNRGDRKNGNGDEWGWNHAFKPGFAFTAGILPLLSFPVAGIIWYQGESNSLEKDRVEEYNDLLELMVNDYRRQWQQPDMPFYWVQLSSIDTATYASQYWPQFRNEQRLFLQKIKNGGMAVSSDAGLKNDVHPRNKKIVGERLARWALRHTYHRRVTPSGPLPVRARWRNGEVIVKFRYGKGLRPADGDMVRGFSIDGEKTGNIFFKKNKVIIPVNTKPGFITYGWAPFTTANLVNAEGLPASTFKIPVR